MDSTPYNGRLCTCGTALTGKQRTTCAGCRKRDRHRRTNQERNPGKAKTRPEKRFAGVDGESIDGRFVMLAWATDDGDGHTIEHDEELSTAECLNFLCDIPKGIVCWGFAFGYDVNMMLGDLPERLIQKLHDDTRVRWHNFHIHYVPGKLFEVSRWEGRGRNRRTGGVRVWDMFTWIQTSFARWIAPGGWDLADADQLAQIEHWKAKRSTFAADDLADIRDYNVLECRLLAKGARRLVTLISDAGVDVKGQYYSAATVAAALMRTNDVNEYRKDPPPQLVGPIQEAYFGGRAETSIIGPVEGPIYGYDIRSAYPSEAVGLPCLVCGRWRSSSPTGENRYIAISRVKPWSLVRVSWRPLRGRPAPMWGPLPKRPRVGSNMWPTHGTGWYWGVEVLAATRHAQITVKECWTYSTPCAHKPFAYLADLYEQRRVLKRAKDPTEYVLKIALNSTYGKLAQRPVRADDEPRFRCVAWAGWITAATRARLLDVLTDDVVLLATDGILSRAPLSAPAEDRLGGWELSNYDDIWCAGTGIYFGRLDGEWTTTKTRGFESGDLTLEMFVAMWAKDGRVGRTTLTRQRFVGMGVALHRIKGMQPPHLRQWRTFMHERVDKTLDQEPRRAWHNDDVRDGRTVAPPASAAKRQEREGRIVAQRFRAEYVRLLAALEEHRAVSGNADHLAFWKWYDRTKEEVMLDRLLFLETVIRAIERRLRPGDEDSGDYTLFDASDDPTA